MRGGDGLSGLKNGDLVEPHDDHRSPTSAEQTCFLRLKPTLSDGLYNEIDHVIDSHTSGASLAGEPVLPPSRVPVSLTN